MRDFIGHYWTQLRTFDRSHGRGMSVESDKLNLVSPTVIVNVNHSTYVPSFESLGCNRHLQDNSVMFANHRLPFCGYAVTNRGRSRPLSMIQMVRTVPTEPFGPWIVPSTIYLIP